jgi:TfoX/Sxy family transcriptional regulator of competence genes
VVGLKNRVKALFFLFSKGIYNKKTMAKVILTETQLKKLESQLKESEVIEGKDGNYMAKQQLFIIATLAQKMWEIMEDNEELDDWMESKIAQAEQSLTSVVKAYMYDELTDDMKGMETLNYNEIVIGK